MSKAPEYPAGTSISASWSASPRGFGNALPSPVPGKRLSVWKWIRLATFLLLVAIRGSALVHHVFTLRTYSHRAVWHHGGHVANLDQLHGKGTIYLLQLGPHTDPYFVVDLAEWLRDTYSLNVQVLTPTALDPAAWDSSRHLYVAERLNDQIKREHPALAADANSWLIGFTDAGMYSAGEPWKTSFSQRDHRGAAIISAEGMGDSTLESTWQQLTTPRGTANARLQDRLRRILLRDVAILYWHLPLNNDPGSLLQAVLDPDIPTSTLYQSDLDPLHSQWGAFVPEPCITFTYAQAQGLRPSPGSLIRQCQDAENVEESPDTGSSLTDTSQERMEVRLRDGLLTEMHTDFYLPGDAPIRFERALDNRSLIAQAFGLSGSNNYDRYLVSYDQMLHISIAGTVSGDTVLARTPAWLSSLDLAKWTDTQESGSYLTLRWRTEPGDHFDLIRFDGEVESYMPCTDSEFCYLNGYRSSNGKVLTIDRDAQRRLAGLSATPNTWLHFVYDAEPETERHIASILDSQGRRVVYHYSHADQLESVTYPSGEVLSYTYDGQQNLLTVSAATADTASTVLVTNTYKQGKLQSQTLADGSVYRYGYVFRGAATASIAAVRTPDGTTYELLFASHGVIVHQLDAVPSNASTKDRAS